MTQLPFQAALGSTLDLAAPKVKEHLLQPLGTQRYRGVMNRVWRRSGWRGLLAGIFLRMGQWTDTLFADTGNDVPFELENTVALLPDGTTGMTWNRTFHFPNGTWRFCAVMAFVPQRGALIDWIGKARHLEVELYARIEDGKVKIRSGRQWFNLKLFRVPLPSLLAGRAEVDEWQKPDGSLGIRVTISNPLLGEFFGYEGSFTHVN